MQNESIDIALEVANQVERLPEQYRVVAFRVLLEHSLGIRPAALHGPSITKVSVSEEMSFSEFLNEFEELKINPQKFAAVAYYYELQRHENNVTQEEIIDSMIDAGIHSGDILIVDRALEPVDNNVVIALINGELTVKRIRKVDDKLFLIADNSQYEPIQIQKEMDFEIWGVVTNVIHSL